VLQAHHLDAASLAGSMAQNICEAREARIDQRPVIDVTLKSITGE